MEPSQKLLQELSDLTRNLDVLAKEIRESNKINSESQKTLSKTVENSVKKESEASKKATAESKQSPAANQSSNQSVSSPAESTPKSSASETPGGKIAKQAGLGSLKAAGMSFLKGGSIKDIVSAGLKGGISEGKKSAVNEAIGGISAVQTKKEELKNKEKPVSEEKEDKKESVLDKLNPLKTEKKRASPEEFDSYLASLSRDEKMSLINGLESGKITKDDVQRMIREKGKSEGSTSESKDKGSKKSERKGFFSSLVEKLKPKEESKEVKPIESPKSDANAKTAEAKSSSEVVTKAPELTEGERIKGELKKAYEGSALGKTVAGVKSLAKKFKEGKEGKSEMKKEEQTLKSESTKATPTPPTPDKGTSGSDTPKEPSKETPSSTPATTPSSGSTTPSASKPSGSSSTKPAEPGISAQDIQDIKALLSAINTTLSGPLNVKDNKPFRPKSNMLE